MALMVHDMSTLLNLVVEEKKDYGAVRPISPQSVVISPGSFSNVVVFYGCK